MVLVVVIVREFGVVGVAGVLIVELLLEIGLFKIFDGVVMFDVIVGCISGSGVETRDEGKLTLDDGAESESDPRDLGVFSFLESG